MGDERHEEHDPGEREPAIGVTAIVEAQVEAARAGIFAAYVRARERGRAAAADDPTADDRRPPT